MDKQPMDDDHLRLFLTKEQMEQLQNARKQLQNMQHFYFGFGMVVAILGVWIAWLMNAALWDNTTGPGIAFGSFALGLYYMFKGKPDINGKV